MKANKFVKTAVTSSVLAALTMSVSAHASPKFLNIVDNYQGNQSQALNLNEGSNAAVSSVDNRLKFNDNRDNAGKNLALAPGGSADGGMANAWMSLFGKANSEGGEVKKMPIAGEVDNEHVSQANMSASSAVAADLNLQFTVGGMQSNSMGDFNAVNNDIDTPSDVINQNCIVCSGNHIGSAYMDSYTKMDFSGQYKDAVIARGGSYATDEGEIYFGHNIEKGKGNINDGDGNENGKGHIDNDMFDKDINVNFQH